MDAPESIAAWIACVLSKDLLGTAPKSCTFAQALDGSNGSVGVSFIGKFKDLSDEENSVRTG